MTDEIYTSISSQHFHNLEDIIRVLFDLFPVGLTLTDKNGKILRCNKISESLVGLPVEEHEKLHLASEEWNIIRPDGTKMHYKDLPGTRAIKENRFIENIEMGILKKNGVIKWLSVSAIPVPIGEYGVIIAYRDITESKILEENLRKSEEKYRLLADNISDVIWKMDLKTMQFTYISPSVTKLRGYTVEEAISQRIEETITPESMQLINKILPEKIAAFYSGIESARINIFEVEQYCKDGSLIWLEVVTTFLTDEKGEISEVIGVSRNIDHRKKAEEVLKRNQEELAKAYEAAKSASKAKSEFLTNMTHELRTPLNAILGYAHLLKNDEILEDKQKRKINVIEKSSKHLLNLINDLLDLAKIEAKKIEIEKHHFNLRNLLSFVEEIIKVKTGIKELTFITEYSRDLPDFVTGDEQKLSQILINLLNNAVKFTHNGKIIFKVEKKDKKLLFSVEDTGIGIKNIKIEDIFSPFEQLANGFSKTEGTGLGLTISKNLVQLMGGKLIVESIYGKGSKFWFEIELEEVLLPEWTHKERNILLYKNNEEEIILPEKNILKSLYNLAKNGKLISLKEELEKINTLDKRYKVFYNKMKQLADAFEMKSINILLKKYLTQTSSDTT